MELQKVIAMGKRGVGIGGPLSKSDEEFEQLDNCNWYGWLDRDAEDRAIERWYSNEFTFKWTRTLHVGYVVVVHANGLLELADGWTGYPEEFITDPEAYYWEGHIGDAEETKEVQSYLRTEPPWVYWGKAKVWERLTKRRLGDHIEFVMNGKD